MAAFLNFDREHRLQDTFDLPAYVTSIINWIHEVRTHNAQHFSVYKDHFEGYIHRLLKSDHAHWLVLMISQPDFSSANLFIVGDEVSCIYDFDTACLVNRLIFIGNMLNSCLHLDWKLVKKGLVKKAGPLPPDDLICGAALLIFLATALDRIRDRIIPWPDANQFEALVLDKIQTALNS